MSTEEKLYEESAQAIINFVKSQVSRSDALNVETEFKKHFVLANRKSKNQKQKAKKKECKNLTRKQKKALGFYSIPRNSIRYKDALPMHKMWLDYMSSVLGTMQKSIPECNSKGWENFTQTLYKADFHGSLLEVVQSRCPSYVGKKGICVMDTRDTFNIVSQNNIMTMIPKRISVFDMYFRTQKVTLFGKHLCNRPAERSTKKIKSYLHPDLY